MVLISGVLEYVIICFSLITVFIGEVRASSIIHLVKRYGSPYIIGTTMMITGIIFEKVKGLKYNSVIWCAIIIGNLIISPINQQWINIYGYREEASYVKCSIKERYPQLSEIVDLIDTVNNYKEKLYILIDKDYIEARNIVENIDDFLYIPSLSLMYHAAPMVTYVEFGNDRDKNDIIGTVDWNKFSCIIFITEDKQWKEMFYFDSEEEIQPFKVYEVVYENGIHLKGMR